MSRRYVARDSYSVGTVDASDLHDVTQEQFAYGVEFIGGSLATGERGELILLWSPRACERFGIPRADYRQVFATFRSVPLPLIDMVIDAYWDQVDAHKAAVEAAEELVTHPCRPCRAAGRVTKAVRELFGLRAFCEPCWVKYAGEVAVIPEPPRSAPIHGVFCKDCYQQIFHGPNVAEQFAAIGRFSRRCPSCWLRATRHGVKPEDL